MTLLTPIHKTGLGQPNKPPHCLVGTHLLIQMSLEIYFSSLMQAHRCQSIFLFTVLHNLPNIVMVSACLSTGRGIPPERPPWSFSSFESMGIGSICCMDCKALEAHLCFLAILKKLLDSAFLIFYPSLLRSSCSLSWSYHQVGHRCVSCEIFRSFT